MIRPDESGRSPPEPLHARIVAYIPGRHAYKDPMVPWDPMHMPFGSGDWEYLPHYLIRFAASWRVGEITERITCQDLHNQWRLVSPRLLTDQDYSLQLLNTADPQYASVAKEFTAAWHHPAPHGTPSVKRIIRIQNASDVVARFEARCAAITALRGDCKMKRLFHGTSGACDLGITPNIHKSLTMPCQYEGCAICNICCTGFNELFCNTHFRNPSGSGGRYGAGLYFSATSSKSNDYADGMQRNDADRTYRAVLLCNVAAGKSYETRVGRPFMKDTQMKSILADGHDSIHGIPSDACNGLNYDELVVYGEDQVIPAFLIVYELHTKRRRVQEAPESMQTFVPPLLQSASLKMVKCEFGITEGNLLGHTVKAGQGVMADPTKVAAVVNMQRPNTESDVRTLSGRTRFRGSYFCASGSL